MDEFQARLNYTNATEWFCKIHDSEINGRMYTPDEEDNFKNEEVFSDGCTNNMFEKTPEELENEFGFYQQTLPFKVGKIINKMSPVSPFCGTIPNNNHNLVLNNLNRTKSLDNLNFEEKRQIIASSLSLADILSQGAILSIFYGF